MNKLRTFILLVIILITTSCSSINTLSTSLFPISLGIDYIDGSYHIIYLLDSKDNDDDKTIVKGVGSSLAEAESNLSFSITKTINPSFIKSIIIGKSVTEKTDFVGLLLYYLSDPIFIKSSYIYITNEDLATFYQKANNFDDISIYPLLTTKEGIPIKALIRPLTLINVASHYLDSLQRVYLPSLSIDEADNKIYLESTCFTTYEDKFSLECLSNNDTKGLRWIDNISGIIITPKGFETTLKGVVSSNKVTYIYKNSNIHIKLDTSISIATIYEDININELIDLFKETITEEIENTYHLARSHNVDIYNLKGYVMKEYSEDLTLENEIDISINITINTKSHH